MPAMQDIHPFDRHVGGQLRRLRKARHISQADLAAALAISFQQIQKYETGANRISASMLVEIALTLQAPISALFEGLPELAAPPSDEVALGPAADLLASPFGLTVATLFPRLPLPVQERFAALLHALAPPPLIGQVHYDWTPGSRSRSSKLGVEIAPAAPDDAGVHFDGPKDFET